MNSTSLMWMDYHRYCEMLSRATKGTAWYDLLKNRCDNYATALEICAR